MRSIEARFVITFEVFLNENNILLPETEFVFAPPRKWRFDYCWPRQKVALEVEGGVWTRGRHTRGAGFLKDMEKYNEAARLGYLVLRTTPTTMWHDATISLIHDTLIQAES